MIRTVLIEPVGLASADRVAAALLEEEYRLTGLPAVLVHLDLNRRGLPPLDNLFTPVGAEEPGGSFAETLTKIANGESVALHAAPLQGRNGRIVLPGVDLEGTWQKVEAAVLATGLSLPMAECLSDALQEVSQHASLLLLTTPGLSPLTLAAIAQADLVALCFRGGSTTPPIVDGVKRLHKLLRLFGGRQPRQLLGVRVGGVKLTEPDRIWAHLMRDSGWVGESAIAEAASDDEDALRLAIRRPWLSLRGVTD